MVRLAYGRFLRILIMRPTPRIEFVTPCEVLTDNHHCSRYAHLPQVCRDHTNDDCEFDGPAGAADFELFFPNYQSMLKYCRKRFKCWDKRFKPAA